jgi:hypothetical protein
LTHLRGFDGLRISRNRAIGILRARGDRNIAAALRRNARDATPVLPCWAAHARETDKPTLC